MAGRRTATRPVLEEVAVEAPVEVTEEAVPNVDETVAEDAPEAPVEKAAPVEVNIDSFLLVLNAGLAEKDESTGVLSVEVVSNILKAYRELPDLKSKSRARAYVNDGMREAVDETDMPSARAYMILSKELSSTPTKAAKGEKTPRQPKVAVDPTVAFVADAVRLRLAMQIHADNKTDDINDEWRDQVSAKLEELRPQLATWRDYLDSEDVEAVEVPEVDPLVVKAFKTAAGKSVGAAAKSTPKEAAGDGIRRRVGVHLAEVFADKDPGTFLTVAQIRAFKSAEYGDTPPSAGAITARLFPKDKDGSLKATTVEGIEGAEDEAGHKGARKIAA